MKWIGQWQLKFILMIIFTLLLFLLKITVGHFSNSNALVADSFHMLTDFAALIIGYLALKYSKKHTNGKTTLKLHKFTFGWIRAEILGGLINIVFLFALCFAVLISSLRRMVIPEPIKNPKPVLIVGCVSLCVNFIGLFLFRHNREDICSSCCCWGKKRTIEKRKLLLNDDDDDEDNCSSSQGRPCKEVYHHPYPSWNKDYQTPHSLNVRGVFLHILEHFLSSFVVIFTASVSFYFHDEQWVLYIDPTFTMILVVFIFYLSVPMFKETVKLFMQSVPATIDLQQVRHGLVKQVPNVVGVHEFHVWHLGADQIVASAHIMFNKYEDYEEEVELVKSYFHNQGISCVTLQPEFLHQPPGDDPDNESLDEREEEMPHHMCHYKCDDCAPPNSCCNEGESTA